MKETTALRVHYARLYLLCSIIFIIEHAQVLSHVFSCTLKVQAYAVIWHIYSTSQKVCSCITDYSSLVSVSLPQLSFCCSKVVRKALLGAFLHGAKRIAPSSLNVRPDFRTCFRSRLPNSLSGGSCTMAILFARHEELLKIVSGDGVRT